MKKVISILLAMLLAAGLFIPAVAEGEDTYLQVDIIGNYTMSSQRIARGNTLALEASFTPPEGFYDEPSIEWTVGGKVAGTGRTLELMIDKDEKGGDNWNPTIHVSVKVTYTATDENGEVLKAVGECSTEVHVDLKLVPKVLQVLGLVLIAPFALVLPALFALGALLMLPVGAVGWLWGWVTSMFRFR